MKKILILLILFSIHIYAKLIIYKEGNFYGYKNNNKKITKAIYEEARVFNGDYAIVKKNGLYGIIDKNGKNKIKCINAQISFILPNIVSIAKKYINVRYLYSLQNNTVIMKDVSKVTYINENAKFIVFRTSSSIYYSLYATNNNICEVMFNKTSILKSPYMAYETSREKGILDLSNCKKKDTIVKKIKHKHFKNLMTFGEKKYHIGVKNSKGEIILDKKYASIRFDDNASLIYATSFNVNKKEYYAEIYSFKGKKIINKKFYLFIMGTNSTQSLDSNTLGIQDTNRKFGLIDINGKILQPFIYDGIWALEEFNIYFARSYDGSKEYFFSKKGNIILEADRIYSIQNHLIKYGNNNNKIGLWNLDGKKNIKPLYDDIKIILK